LERSPRTRAHRGRPRRGHEFGGRVHACQSLFHHGFRIPPISARRNDLGMWVLGRGVRLAEERSGGGRDYGGVVVDGMIALRALLLVTATHTQSAALDTALIEQLTGAKGKLDRAANVFKVSVPRADLAVTVGGVKLIPPSGLTSWAAFEPAGSSMMVMA